MTEPTELLPCPFCGGTPTTIERPDNIDGTQFFYAIACYCGRHSACAHKMAVRKTPEIAKADAIAAWNTRATPPAQAADSVLEDAALPMQPICVTADGVVRFKKNRMVNDMYEFSQPRGFGLNEMARRDYTQEERMQFAQLIGYSVSGYGGLSYASPESAAKADTMAEALLAARKQGGA